jgi:DNA-binding NarL/FixJ family response regulator
LTLPTVVVCDSAEKSNEIASLVKSQPDLALIETVSRQAAREQISNVQPKLVWLELAPEPNEAINLLSELSSHNPGTHFLVSYDTVNADLVKATMHLGVIDYLDPQSWQKQLPEAISRVLVKEKTVHEQLAASHNAPSQIDLSYQSDKEEQAGENKEFAQVELPSWPIWVIPSLGAILLLVLILALFARW